MKIEGRPMPVTIRHYHYSLSYQDRRTWAWKYIRSVVKHFLSKTLMWHGHKVYSQCDTGIMKWQCVAVFLNWWLFEMMLNCLLTWTLSRCGFESHCWPLCSGHLSLLPFMGREMSSSLLAVGWRPSDCGGGMSAYSPQVQLFASTGSGWLHNALRYH